MSTEKTVFMWPVSFKTRKMFEISWKRGELVGSRCFASKDNTLWNLCIYPLGDSPSEKEVTLRLCRHSTGTKIYVEGDIVLSKSADKEYSYPFKQSLSKTDTYIRVPLYENLKEMYKYFPSSRSFYIKCQFTIIDMFNDGKSECSAGTSSVTSGSSFDGEFLAASGQDLQKLSEDFDLLLKNEYFSDVILRCDNTDMPLHKNILSARSKTFAKLFEPSISKSSVIAVNNMDVNVLKEMVSYIYTGKHRNLNHDMARKLFVVAIAYGIEDLQRICCDFIVSRLTIYNVADELLFMNEVQCEELKEPVHQFLCEHFSEIKHTDSWKKFVKEQPALGVEILSAIM